MRLRLRLRTALVGIALLSPPLYGAAVVARYGGIEGFRRHHAMMAYRYWREAYNYEGRLHGYREHAAPGHSCAVCRAYDRPVGEPIAELQRLQRECERKMRWHEFLSGREVLMVHL